jgi:hypothetical protein
VQSEQAIDALAARIQALEMRVPDWASIVKRVEALEAGSMLDSDSISSNNRGDYVISAISGRVEVLERELAHLKGILSAVTPTRSVRHEEVTIPSTRSLLQDCLSPSSAWEPRHKAMVAFSTAGQDADLKAMVGSLKRLLRCPLEIACPPFTQRDPPQLLLYMTICATTRTKVHLNMTQLEAAAEWCPRVVVVLWRPGVQPQLLDLAALKRDLPPAIVEVVEFAYRQNDAEVAMELASNKGAVTALSRLLREDA